MKKTICIIAIAVLLTMLFSPLMALASTITGALYSGTVQVTNNSTATSEVITVFTANLTDYDATGENTAIQYSGNDVAFSPPYPGSNIWNVFIDAIGLDMALGKKLPKTAPCFTCERYVNRRTHG